MQNDRTAHFNNTWMRICAHLNEQLLILKWIKWKNNHNTSRGLSDWLVCTFLRHMHFDMWYCVLTRNFVALQLKLIWNWINRTSNRMSMVWHIISFSLALAPVQTGTDVDRLNKQIVWIVIHCVCKSSSNSFETANKYEKNGNQYTGNSKQK